MSFGWEGAWRVLKGPNNPFIKLKSQKIHFEFSSVASEQLESATHADRVIKTNVFTTKCAHAHAERWNG